MENEKWVYIQGTQECYQVSNTGKVRGINTRFRKNLFPFRELSQTKWGSGYLTVSLCLDGSFSRNARKTFTVHRLVAMHFLANPDNLPMVNHKDGRKDNNHVNNLEWVTAIGNIYHAIESGLSPRFKLKTADVNFIRENFGKISADDLAKKFGVLAESIRSIAANKTRNPDNLPIRDLRKTQKCTRRVINTSTGKIFDCIADAYSEYGATGRANFYLQVSGKSKTNPTPYRIYLAEDKK